MTTTRGLAHVDTGGTKWETSAAAALAAAHRDFSVRQIRSTNFSGGHTAASTWTWHHHTSSQAVAAVVAKSCATFKIIAASVAGLRAKGWIRIAESVGAETRATIIIACTDIAGGLALYIERNADIAFTGTTAAFCAIRAGLAIRRTLVVRTSAVYARERTTIGPDGARTAVGDATAGYGSTDIEHLIAVLRTATSASGAVSAIDIAVPVRTGVDGRTAIAACGKCQPCDQNKNTSESE